MKTHCRSIGRISIGLALVALGLGLAARPAQAQLSPGALKNTPREYTNKTMFHLPIEIDPKSRSSVREVVLFSKEGNGPWMKKDSAPPTQKHFTCQVAGEGEYWFSVVTVDTMGRSNPVDVTKEPPMLIVVVDSTPPVVEVMPVNSAGGQMALRCLIKDSSPDYQQLQLFFQQDGQNWVALEPMPGMAGMFRLPSTGLLNGTVRYVAKDRARNENKQEVVLKELTAPTPPAAPGVANPPLPLSGTPGAQPVHDTQLVKYQTGPNAKPTVPDPPALPPAAKQLPGNTSLVPLPPGSPGAVSDFGSKTPVDPPLPFVAPGASPLPQTKPALVSASGNKQLISTPHASIDYRLDKVGPSGVSKVDIWVKGETASSWSLMATDMDRKTPVDIQLPHEGLFGIRLAVTNGNGFGGTPPTSNDAATFWIEVDTTPPFAQLLPVGPVTSGDSLDIRWTATDKNLGSEPVTLLFSTQKNGPWQPIARNIKNTGQLNWQFPRDIGPQFYLRLEVADAAGNVLRTDLPQPVTLDLIEPQAQVVGVTGVTGGKN